jgi:hypothetical protein
MNRHDALLGCTCCKANKLLFFGSFWLLGFVIDKIFGTLPMFMIILATIGHFSGFFLVNKKFKKNSQS